MGSLNAQHPACAVPANTHISVGEQQPLPQHAPTVQHPDEDGQEETAMPLQLTKGPGFVGEVCAATRETEATKIQTRMPDLRIMLL